MESFKKLVVWNKSIDLVKSVYQFSEKISEDEKYGIISQMKRSSVSIPSNIAEGSRRGHLKEYIQFLYISRGSLAELETQILLVKELFGIESKEVMGLIEEIGKLLNALIHSLKNKL